MPFPNGFPVIIDGETFVQNDVFGPDGFEYLTGLPNLVDKVATVAAQVESDRVIAETSATQAVNAVANAMQTTSSSNVAIGLGAKTFTTVDDLDNDVAFIDASWVKIVRTGDSSEYMAGIVTSATANTLIVDVDTSFGAGTHNDWSIFATGAPGADGQIDFTTPSSEDIDTDDLLAFGDVTDGDNAKKETIFDVFMYNNIMMELF